jgi:putative ABC transport system substrate-binding protein
MRRRAFIRLLGGAAAAWPVARAHAQRGGPPTVGVLMAGNEDSTENKPRIAALRQGLADRGWKEGETIRLVYRWSAGRRELIDQYAKELVALNLDVIVANSTPVIASLHKLNPSTPVVFALAMDPIGLGQVKSLSRPGGNFTGFTFIDPELIGKWMQLLRDAIPDVSQAALLFNPRTVHSYLGFVEQVRGSRRPGSVEIQPLPAASTEEMVAAMTALARTPGSGLMIGPDPFNQVRLKQIADLALQLRLPTISVYRPFVEAGGLMMYGPDTADIFRRAAAYVDRVLKGEKTADLPVQQPNKFEFVINLKAAKALGIVVPPVLQAAADEVIE